MQHSLCSWYTGGNNICRRTTHESCWCMSNALSGDSVGLAGLALLSSGDPPANSEAQMCLARSRRLYTQWNHQASKKLCLITSADWTQIQIPLKAKLLKWWTEHTDFFFFFLPGAAQWRQTQLMISFLSLLCGSTLSPVGEVSVFHPNNSSEHWSVALKSRPYCN